MKIQKYLKNISANISFRNISTFSAQCSYYTILSFIPFIILLLTLIQYTGLEQETLFALISKLVPSNMNELVLGIVKEVYSKSLGTISVSIVITMWSAGRGLLALTRGLHSAYDINDKKSNSAVYLRIKSIIETVIFIVFIVLGLVVLVFGSTLISIVQEHFGILENVNFLSGILTELGFIFITFIVFLFVYKFLPKHKVTFRSQIPGAVFGALGLNLVSFVFSRYLDIFKGFSVTYGSLTTLMLIMMWTYACFYTVFLGAELNQNYQKMF